MALVPLLFVLPGCSPGFGECFLVLPSFPRAQVRNWLSLLPVQGTGTRLELVRVQSPSRWPPSELLTAQVWPLAGGEFVHVGEFRYAVIATDRTRCFTSTTSTTRRRRVAGSACSPRSRPLAWRCRSDGAAARGGRRLKTLEARPVGKRLPHDCPKPVPSRLPRCRTPVCILPVSRVFP
jgi:hypothetical protein